MRTAIRLATLAAALVATLTGKLTLRNGKA